MPWCELVAGNADDLPLHEEYWPQAFVAASFLYNRTCFPETQALHADLDRARIRSSIPSVGVLTLPSLAVASEPQLFGRLRSYMLTHADFDNAGSANGDWRLNDWSAAVRIALGWKALLLFRVALVAVLAPSLLVAVYSIYAPRPMLLVWVALGFLGFQARSTAPTGIGVICSIVVAAIGLIIGLIRNDWILFACGIVPGATWLGSCAILGTTAQYVGDAARSCEETFLALTSRGVLTNAKFDSSKATD